MRSARPPDTCCSIAKSSAIFTGSFVVMRVVEVVRISRSVWAAMYASVVVGDDDQNGGLWCSPRAKTSRPTSSVCLAIVSVSLMRWASLGVLPVVGSWVMSLTVMTPNCIPGQLFVSFTMPLLLYASEYTS